jgi:hypothetical protein
MILSNLSSSSNLLLLRSSSNSSSSSSSNFPPFLADLPYAFGSPKFTVITIEHPVNE